MDPTPTGVQTAGAGGGGRRGGALAESLVALLLTAGLLIAMAGVLAQHARATRTLTRRIEGIEAARMARDLISSAVTADPDARVGEDGLRVRTFAGFAERCGEEGWGYRGRRLPDPLRDSLWIVTSSGRVEVAVLTGVGEAECGPGSTERVLALTAEPPLSPEALLIRVFESGRYRVDDAVRYGRTGSGAQPLSAPVLDPSRSGLVPAGPWVEVTVVPEGRPRGYAGRWGR